MKNTCILSIILFLNVKLLLAQDIETIINTKPVNGDLLFFPQPAQILVNLAYLGGLSNTVINGTQNVQIGSITTQQMAEVGTIKSSGNSVFMGLEIGILEGFAVRLAGNYVLLDTSTTTDNSQSRIVRSSKGISDPSIAGLLRILGNSYGDYLIDLGILYSPGLISATVANSKDNKGNAGRGGDVISVAIRMGHQTKNIGISLEAIYEHIYERIETQLETADTFTTKPQSNFQLSFGMQIIPRDWLDIYTGLNVLFAPESQTTRTPSSSTSARTVSSTSSALVFTYNLGFGIRVLPNRLRAGVQIALASPYSYNLLNSNGTFTAEVETDFSYGFSLTYLF